jgi:hypothetical protein
MWAVFYLGCERSYRTGLEFDFGRHGDDLEESERKGFRVRPKAVSSQTVARDWTLRQEGLDDDCDEKEFGSKAGLPCLT